jgi:hypothetical protein
VSIVDRIAEWYVGRKVSGWNTKFGAAALTLAAVISVLSGIVESLQIAADGHYLEAARAFMASPELWAGLGFFGITKMGLGIRSAQDKLATGELQPDAATVMGLDVRGEMERKAMLELIARIVVSKYPELGPEADLEFAQRAAFPPYSQMVTVDEVRRYLTEEKQHAG